MPGTLEGPGDYEPPLLAGLDQLPYIGATIARSIRQLLTIGRLPMLDRLRGELDPVALLTSVPAIGSRLAHLIHDDLDISTLEALEVAAHDGTLERAGGFGPKRLTAIRDALAARLGRVRQPGPRRSWEPPVDELLDVDLEYRSRADAGTLRLIAPRRFNPSGRAWLPVLHTERQGREYTALYSNTARAHQLDKTRDWVVLYYHTVDGERQCTVVTASTGILRGRRVVRGREAECEDHHRGSSPTADVSPAGR
jgi:hypothetical protein